MNISQDKYIYIYNPTHNIKSKIAQSLSVRNSIFCTRAKYGLGFLNKNKKDIESEVPINHLKSS